MNNKLPEWRKALNSAVENYQSAQSWYEENKDSPSAEQDVDAAAGGIEKLLKQYGVLIVLSLMDEIDELQDLRRSCLALRGEIEDVQAQLYEAENRNNADDEELQERRKADSAEPLAWTDEEELRDLRAVGFCEMFSVEPISKDADIRRVIPLYRHAQPVPERDRVRREHAEWSDKTFGDVGPVGPLKHLSKEALEAAANPEDPLEWADMQFLLWDAQRRMGISDNFITRAMIEKLAINKTRQWPEPKDGEPRLHIKKSGNSPVIPDGYVMVPKRLTAENGAKGVLSGEFSETKFINCPECFGDDECETCDGSGRIEITVPVTWTTIKAVWAKGVELFAAAPQQDKSHG